MVCCRPYLISTDLTEWCQAATTSRRRGSASRPVMRICFAGLQVEQANLDLCIDYSLYGDVCIRIKFCCFLPKIWSMSTCSAFPALSATLFHYFSLFSTIPPPYWPAPPPGVLRFHSYRLSPPPDVLHVHFP